VLSEAQERVKVSLPQRKGEPDLDIFIHTKTFCDCRCGPLKEASSDTTRHTKCLRTLTWQRLLSNIHVSQRRSDDLLPLSLESSDIAEFPIESGNAGSQAVRAVGSDGFADHLRENHEAILDPGTREIYPPQRRVLLVP
jgi:hypothetical protein